MATVLSLLWSSSIRIAAVSVAAWLLTLALRRSSAAARHAIWACTIAAALLMPALLQLPTPPVVVPASQSPAVTSTVAAVAMTVQEPVPATPDVTSATDTIATPVRTAPRGVSILPLVFAAWAAVAGLALLWVFNGLVATKRLRRAHSSPHREWMADGHAIAASLGITNVTFLEWSGTSTPFTSGILSPVVVLSSDAATWPADRLRAVLLHELAHVHRHDCLTQLVTRVACAIYWFHPAVWFAAHRLRIERERACDDVVLIAGIPGAEYGEHLVNIARAALSPRVRIAAGGIAMAHHGRLEERLTSILDPRVTRRAALPVRLAIAVFAALVVAAGAIRVQAEGSTAPATSMADVMLRRDIRISIDPRQPVVSEVQPTRATPPQIQTTAGGQGAVTTPSIEVAVIKRNKELEDQRRGEDPRITRYPGRAQTLRGGTLLGRGMTVKELIRDAYGYRNRAPGEVIGGPAWLDSELYEVQAKFDQEFRLSTSLGLPPEGQLALRTLLADRFHLKAHVEMRRRPIYELVVHRADGRLGPNLKPAKGGCIPFSKREPVNVGLVLDAPDPNGPKPLPPCMAAVSIMGITLENEPMPDWARLLSVRPQINRTVVDRTGLTGNFDFRLVNDVPLQSGGPIMEAPLKPLLESQLGLTLRDAEADVEVLVIDSIDHPEEN